MVQFNLIEFPVVIDGDEKVAQACVTGEFHPMSAKHKREMRVIFNRKSSNVVPGWIDKVEGSFLLTGVDWFSEKRVRCPIACSRKAVDEGVKKKHVKSRMAKILESELLVFSSKRLTAQEYRSHVVVRGP